MGPATKNRGACSTATGLPAHSARLAGNPRGPGRLRTFGVNEQEQANKDD